MFHRFNKYFDPIDLNDRSPNFLAPPPNQPFHTAPPFPVRLPIIIMSFRSIVFFLIKCINIYISFPHSYDYSWLVLSPLTQIPMHENRLAGNVYILLFSLFNTFGR